MKNTFFFFFWSFGSMLGYSGSLFQDKILDPRGCITNCVSDPTSQSSFACQTPTSPAPEPRQNCTFTNPALWCPRLVRSEGTSPMVAGIILSPFWYQKFSLLCLPLKIWRSIVWAGVATMQRIQRILSHSWASHTPRHHIEQWAYDHMSVPEKCLAGGNVPPSGPQIHKFYKD